MSEEQDIVSEAGYKWLLHISFGMFRENGLEVWVTKIMPIRRYLQLYRLYE